MASRGVRCIDQQIELRTDDADRTRLELVVPVIDKNKLLSTSSMITAYRQDPAPSMYVLRRSHTDDMHRAGENGKGRIVNWTAEEIAADMNASADILGVREVMAYPFGHDDGTDKLALPVVRIDYGMGLETLISRIG